MDVLGPILIVALILLALGWSLFTRRRNVEGGITRRQAPPGAASGSAQDSGDGSDREGFRRQVEGGGTH